MAFNLDDPLGDLLSDNGSEDSFAEFLNKKPTTTKTNTSKVNNLFGISENQSSQPPLRTDIDPVKSVITLPPNPTPIIKKLEAEPVLFESNTIKKAVAVPASAKKEITFDDNDGSDLFSDLGFDPKKIKSGSSMKKSINLDDILGITESKTPQKIDAVGTIANKTINNTSQIGTYDTSKESTTKPLTRQSTIDRTIEPQAPKEDMTSNVGYAPLSRPRTATSSKRNSNAEKSNDPLGFFGNTSNTVTEANNKKPNTTVDWLGLGNNHDQVTARQSKSEQSHHLQQDASVAQTQLLTVPTHQPSVVHVDTSLANIFKPNLLQTAQLLNTANTEANTAMQNLQQQETQLMVANQMRNQEAVLIDLQRRQHEMLQKQEQHFNELLQKQMHRQATLEDNIRMQQERINSHINMLLVQPSIVPHDIVADTLQPSNELTAKVSGETLVEMRVEIKRLEMENLRLSDMCEHSKENHDQELNLLEASHRMQMGLVEENLKKLESRLREENASLEEFYGKKLDEVIGDKQKTINDYESKIKQLIEEHSISLERLNTERTEELKRIRLDHVNMLENIRQSKHLEFSLVQENSSYLQTLKSASGYLETASEDLQTIRNDFEKQIVKITQDREIQLAAREKRVEDQQKHFENLRESTESERIALLELVRTLETKLNTVNQSADEEKWAIRQQRATLDAERIAFERERNFMRERQSREEKRIEDLKSTQAEDYQRLVKQIEDDRLAIIAEKMKLETQARLQQSQNVNVSRAEIDAAVQVAQDAARQHDLERERLVEIQQKLESRKRELIDRENIIRSKQIELDTLMNSCSVKQKNADAKLSACKALEQQFLQKLRMLQQNVNDVTAREAKLTQGRYDLGRERLELQSLRRKLHQNRCSLCKIGERSQELGDMLTKTSVDALPPTAGGNTMMQPNLDMESLHYDHRFDGGGPNLEALLDQEVRMELDKMKQFDFVVAKEDADDAEHTMLDPELVLHKFDVLKGEFANFFE